MFCFPGHPVNKLLARTRLCTRLYKVVARWMVRGTQRMGKQLPARERERKRESYLAEPEIGFNRDWFVPETGQQEAVGRKARHRTSPRQVTNRNIFLTNE